MFVGHLAAGLVLKAHVREASLSWLLVGTVASDFLCAVLLMLGVEDVVIEGSLVYSHIRSDIGYSHSLSGSLALAMLAGLIAAPVFRSWRVALAIGLAVLSHFVLDVLTHRHDMALLGFGAAHDIRMGTNLALFPLGMFTVELLWCLFAWWSFDSGNRRLLATLAVLLLLYTNSVFGFAPPPVPSVVVLGASMMVSFVLATLAILHAARASEMKPSTAAVAHAAQMSD